MGKNIKVLLISGNYKRAYTSKDISSDTIQKQIVAIAEADRSSGVIGWLKVLNFSFNNFDVRWLRCNFSIAEVLSITEYVISEINEFIEKRNYTNNILRLVMLGIGANDADFILKNCDVEYFIAKHKDSNRIKKLIESLDNVNNNVLAFNALNTDLSKRAFNKWCLDTADKIQNVAEQKTEVPRDLRELLRG